MTSRRPRSEQALRTSSLSAAGSSAARRRRSSAADGARVTLVEREEVAFGASGRNSGVIQQPFDPALVGLYRRSLELYRDLTSELRMRSASRPAERAC